MFFHNMIYAFKSMLRTKENIFWTFIFPIALATFMNIAFGSVYESTEMTKAVPVAIVEHTENKDFMQTVDTLSKDGDDKILDVVNLKVNKQSIDQAAKNALEDGEIDGIIYVDKKISLTVAQEGISQTMLKVFLERYAQMESTIKNVAEKNPQNINVAIEKLSEDICYYKEVNTSEGNQDYYVTYFYAIFAMSCLFASFIAVDRISKLQPSAGALGQRRMVSPTKKSIVVLSEFISMEVTQFLIEVVTLMYMRFVLGIDFGNKYGALLLLLLVASSFGIIFGMAIGSMKKFSAGAKIGICIGISMLFSVMADLCVGGIKNAIEHTVPIINKLNPAALIVDSFYALNIYDTYDRFAINIGILLAMTVIFAVIDVFMLKRKE